MKRQVIILTESWVTTAVLPLLLEREGGEAGRRKEKKRKKKKKRQLHDSLLDPEIIAHAKSYQECGLSGGQTVVYSLFEVPPPQGLTRGEERERTSGSTAGGWGGFAVE